MVSFCLVDYRPTSNLEEVRRAAAAKDGGMLPSGVYHARLTAEGVVRTRSIVLVK